MCLAYHTLMYVHLRIANTPGHAPVIGVDRGSSLLLVFFMWFTTWQACELVCKFISKHQEAICAALDGRNKDVAVEELAIRFQQTYLAMLTRIQINNTGALLISRDVDTYIDLFKVCSSYDVLFLGGGS